MVWRYKTTKFVAAFAAFAVIIGAGCSSSKPTQPPPPFDVEKSLEKAWGYFSSSNYEDGADLFSRVLEHAESNAEAYLGRGWCLAFTDELDSAFDDLWEAITYDTYNAYTIDANMGLAAVTKERPDYGEDDYYLKEAINRAKAVLETDSNYVFSKRTSIDYKDAHLIIAQCYFRRGAEFFSYAHPTVNYLCDLEGIDTLSDASSIPADEYERQVAEKLETLTDLIGD